MANAGVPSGGQFLPQDISITNNKVQDILGKFFEGGSEFQVDRRTSYGKQAGRIYSGETNALDERMGLTASNKFYEPSTYAVSQTASDAQIKAGNKGQAAFVERDVPTSSTNYSRPRTVAAGYNPDAQTMTVVFRDGTFYNYYEVTQSEWDAFRASYSKGNPWLNTANSNQASDGIFIGKPRGNANMSQVLPEVREALYRVARTWQQKAAPKAGKTKQATALSGGQRISVRNNLKTTTAANKAHSGNKSASRPSRRKSA